MVVGGDYSKENDAVNNAAVTSDGGVTWSLVAGLGGYRSVVTHLPGGNGRQWLALGLDSAYLKRIEAVWTGFLPRGQRAVFDTGSITRMNPREQLDYDIAGVNAGIFTVDEVRAKRGLAPNDALTLQQ